jgi:hypothetical protein
MRSCTGLLVALSLGCSSNSFEIAEPGADSAVADTAVVDSVAVSDGEPPPPDTEVPVSDGGGRSCTTIDGCEVGEYCERPGCDATVGVCKPYVQVPVYNPVCDCGGTTYWNRSYANLADAIVRHVGRCGSVESKVCLGSDCGTPDSLCVHEIANATGCISTTDKGVCWKLPADATCGATPGGAVANCGGKCASYCTGVLTRQTFYQSACTP